MTRIALTQFSKNSRGLELSVCCSFLLLTACGQPIRPNLPPPPQEWLTCEPAPERPALAPLNGVADTYAKPEVDARDSAIARYIIALRAAHFNCANNLEKVRGYFEK